MKSIRNNLGQFFSGLGVDGDFRKGIAQLPLVLVLVLMAIAVPATVKLTEQSQETRSSASGCGGNGDPCCITNTIPPTTWCNAGYKCTNGKCVSTKATPTPTPGSKSCGSHTSGSKWCDGDTLKKCEDGTIKTVTVCAYGCSGSSCKPADESKKCGSHNDGAVWCDGDVRKKCNAGSVSKKTCDYGCKNGSCLTPTPVIAVCEGKYSAGAVWCDGFIAKKCKSDGTVEKTYCSYDEAKVCDHGKCVAPTGTSTPTPKNLCEIGGGFCSAKKCGEAGYNSFGGGSYDSYCGSSSYCCGTSSTTPLPTSDCVTDIRCYNDFSSSWPNCSDDCCNGDYYETGSLAFGTKKFYCGTNPGTPSSDCWCDGPKGLFCADDADCKLAKENPWPVGGTCNMSHCLVPTLTPNPTLIPDGSPCVAGGGACYRMEVECDGEGGMNMEWSSLSCYSQSLHCCVPKKDSKITPTLTPSKGVTGTSTPKLTSTPRPTNTPVPGTPGKSTNTPVPLPTEPASGGGPTATNVPDKKCSEPKGILARVQKTEKDPLETTLKVEKGEKMRLVCVSKKRKDKKGNPELARKVKIVVTGPNGVKEHANRVWPNWSADVDGEYKVQCVSTDKKCKGMSSNVATVNVGSTGGGSCFRCPNEGQPGIIGVIGGDFDCNNQITMDDVGLWVVEYNDTLINGAENDRRADPNCDGKATVDDLSVWIKAYNGGQNE